MRKGKKKELVCAQFEMRTCRQGRARDSPQGEVRSLVTVTRTRRNEPRKCVQVLRKHRF